MSSIKAHVYTLVIMASAAAVFAAFIYLPINVLLTLMTCLGLALVYIGIFNMLRND